MANKTTKERLTSRKFILSVILYISMTVFVLTGNMDVDQYWQYSLIILGIYTGGNVVDHISDDYKQKEETKSRMEYEKKMEELKYQREKHQVGSASREPRREVITDAPTDFERRTPRPPVMEDNEIYQRRG